VQNLPNAQVLNIRYIKNENTIAGFRLLLYTFPRRVKLNYTNIINININSFLNMSLSWQRYRLSLTGPSLKAVATRCKSKSVLMINCLLQYCQNYIIT